MFFVKHDFLKKNLKTSGGTCIYWAEYSCLFTPKPKAFGILKRGIERALELAHIRWRHRTAGSITPIHQPTASLLIG
jgi:hypothetical protein